MILSKIQSERLSVIRFPLIVCVVFIHAYGAILPWADGYLDINTTCFFSSLVSNLVSQGVARIAVPMFFLMSGYLFFLDFDCSKERYKLKLISRLKTLFIPFLFWNLLVLIIYSVGQSIPITEIYFNASKENISQFEIYDYVNAIFGVDKYPIAYQFWFIRDLIVLILFSPLFYFFNKTAGKLFLISLFILWFFDLWLFHVPSIGAILFFFIGSYLAYNNIDLFFVDRFEIKILTIYVLVLLLDVFSSEFHLHLYIHKIGIIFGVASGIILSKFLLINKKVKNFFMWAGSCSFFVYAAHEPLLTAVGKVTYRFIDPSNGLLNLSLYFLIPVTILVSLLSIYTVLKFYFPKVTSFVSGGR